MSKPSMKSGSHCGDGKTGGDHCDQYFLAVADKLAAGVENNPRFIGLHFFNPAPLMKLIEIIPSYFTSRTTSHAASSW